MLRRTLKRSQNSGRIRTFLAVLGPGIIAASAGNDAGGVTTYSQAGASYGYGLLWVMLLLTFSLAVAQEMGARMAAVTGKGLADLIREEFGVRTALFAMVALVVANISTTVAEFAGVLAVVELFLPSGVRWIVVPMAALGIWWLVAKGSYRRVERVFLVMCLVYLAYVVALFIVKPNWPAVFKGTFAPSLAQTRIPGYLQMVIALVGTTIAPWMQFYVQSSVRDKGIRLKDYPMERLDVLAGSVLSNFISFCIIVTCAATLFVQHISVESASDAAKALQPVVGSFSTALFALGLFNAAMVGAVAVPLSTAYAVTESLGWERGVGRRIREAPLFIGVYTAVIVISALVVLAPKVPLIPVILVAQVINGMLLPVILVLMLRLINQRRLMGDHVNGRAYNIVAGTTVGIVSVLSLVYLVQSIVG
jgi:NRAMP (natural resistance-associated macrophage protein)-like metal ion transporter